MIIKEGIPPIEKGKIFTYLEKRFNFSMTYDDIKSELCNETVKYVDITEKLPIKCLHQIEIF